MSKLLDRINGPEDLRRLDVAEFSQLADEIRQRIIEVVGRHGGHLASNLGVVELTIALHYCLDLPADRLVWDVGHQCYPHKLLTGRNAAFETLRQAGGLSGFPSPAESEHDLFYVGHAGTAIPTAVGLALADQMQGRTNRTVAVVGDASIVNGVALEGLNQAGLLKRQFMVVLNDNSLGIAPTRGSLAEYLARFRVSYAYEEVKRKAKQVLTKVPLVGKSVYNALDHLKEGIKATIASNQIFEHLGFIYVGPIDGHDVEHLIELINAFKDVQHPVLLHVHTEKGRGCKWAEAEPTTFHSPAPFEVTDGGEVRIKPTNGKSFTQVFADALIEVARKDERIVALTAAMPDGTGLSRFAEVFPERCFDIGIAESCAVDVAAGMCKAGLKPVVAIYSTFMQRAFDQAFQEVSLQDLPVVFCMDRAGLVGGDGAVHHGFLDIAYLRSLPHMILMAPADEREMHEAMQLAVTCERPCAIRYPRDLVPGPLGDQRPPFELGRAWRLRQGRDVTILAYGVVATYALEAARMLLQRGIEATVYNARFARPLDDAMLRDAFESGRPVITVEDHSVAAGFGAAVLERAEELHLPVQTSKFRRLGIPADKYVPHGSRGWQLRQVGIDADGIVQAVLQLVMPRIARSPRQSPVREPLQSDSIRPAAG